MRERAAWRLVEAHPFDRARGERRRVVDRPCRHHEHSAAEQPLKLGDPCPEQVEEPGTHEEKRLEPEEEREVSRLSN